MLVLKAELPLLEHQDVCGFERREPCGGMGDLETDQTGCQVHRGFTRLSTRIATRKLDYPQIHLL